MVNIKPDSNRTPWQSTIVDSLRSGLLSHQNHWREMKTSLQWLKSRSGEVFGDPANRDTIKDEDAKEIAGLARKVNEALTKVRSDIYNVIPFLLVSSRQSALDFGNNHAMDFNRELMIIMSMLTERKAKLETVNGVFGYKQMDTKPTGLAGTLNSFYTCLLYTSPSPRDRG